MTRLLVVGFGPFPGVPRNPSAALARAIAADGRLARRGIAVEALVMKTAWSSLGEALLPAIRSSRPDAVLLLGVAARRRAVCVERLARNRITRRLPDASGARPGRLTLVAGAPLVRHGRAPIEVLVTAAKRAGPPGAARASRDAGRYLCNGAYFVALAEAAPRAIVFVHVPMPRTGSGRPLDRVHRPRLDAAAVQRIVTAAGEALATTARHWHGRR